MPQLIEWAPDFKQSLRRIDQKTALRILKAISSFTYTGEGDIKRLQGIQPPQYRLRVGEYRVLFRKRGRAIYIEDVTTRQSTDY